MARRTMFLAIVGFLVTSCATIAPRDNLRPTAKECKGVGNCFVDVSVSDKGVSVDTDYVIVNNPRNTPLKITWRLPENSPFTISKVEFPDGGSEFISCMPEGPRMYSCMDKHTTFGVYKYTLTVLGLPPLDPWTVND